MSNLSAQAEQARESARKADGKFGSWEAGESAAQLSGMVEDQTTDPQTEAAAKKFDETIDWYRENIGDDYPFTKKKGFKMHPGEAQGRLNDAAAELGETPDGAKKLHEYINDPQYQGDDGVSRAVGLATTAGSRAAEDYAKQQQNADPDRPVGREEVSHGDPLKIDDGFAELEVTAHGNFDSSSDEINVDNGDGLVLAVKRDELRRRPAQG